MDEGTDHWEHISAPLGRVLEQMGARMSKSSGVRQGEVERLRGQVESLGRKLERSLDDNSRLCRKVEDLELQLMDERRSAVAAQQRAAREEQRRAQLQTRGWR